MQMIHKKMLIIFVLLMVLLPVSCATMPTQEELANLNYGAPLTIDYQGVIKDYFERVLFDPYSAHYKFGTPQSFWYKEPPILGGKLYAGQIVYVGVNAKNRMGGYVGTEEYGFLFKNNQLIKILDPADIRLMRSK